MGTDYWAPVSGDPGGLVGSTIVTVREASGDLAVGTMQGQWAGAVNFLDASEQTAHAKQVALWWSDGSRTETAGALIAAPEYCCYDPMIWAGVTGGSEDSATGAIATLVPDDETVPTVILGDTGAGLGTTAQIPLLRIFGMSSGWIAGTQPGNDFDIAIHALDGTFVESLPNFGFATWAPPPAVYTSAVGDLDGDGHPELVLSVNFFTDSSSSPLETALLIYRGTDGAIGGPPLVVRQGDLGSLPASDLEVFGLSVSVAQLDSGHDALLAGAPRDPEAPSGPGQACVFRFESSDSDPSGLEATGAPSCFENPAVTGSHDAFGIAFAAGDLIPERDGAPLALELAVGAPRMNDGDGAAIVMSLVDGEPRPDIGLAVFDGLRSKQHYGATLAASDHGLIVGAPGDGASLDGRIYDSRCLE